MENEYIISARTEDLLGSPHFVLLARPRGDGTPSVRSANYGYVAFQDSNVRSGMNDVGLVCDKQTLVKATHPPPSKILDNIDAAKICQWALEGFSTVEDLKRGLKAVNFVKSEDPSFAFGHWAFRDILGRGLVLEFTNHSMHIYGDDNDNGKTGYGIMTNDPPFPQHLERVAALRKQEGTAPSTLKMPGDFDSVERFNRIFLLKSNMPKPGSSREALMQAVHVLNSVSVPFDVFGGSTTQWAAVYDHRNSTVYWRSHNNQNLQRVRLTDLNLAEGGMEQQLIVNDSQLKWFTDASALFQPRYENGVSLV